jgi:hypothetical protein
MRTPPNALTVFGTTGAIGASCALDRVGGAQWQAACNRNCARGRETEGKAPSSGELTHENNLPSAPSVYANIGPMRRLAGAVWAQARFKLAHSGGSRRIWARLRLGLAVKCARHQSQSFLWASFIR